MRNFLNFQRTTPLLTKITTLTLPFTIRSIGNRRSDQRANHIYYAKNRVVRPQASSEYHNEFYQC